MHTSCRLYCLYILYLIEHKIYKDGSVSNIRIVVAARRLGSLIGTMQLLIIDMLELLGTKIQKGIN